ncbi:MAG: VTT domain-containing protein [Acidimicrobiia bacterium]|nr:VTT domain-containing protein [Acidimicrobiia bacterium]
MRPLIPRLLIAGLFLLALYGIAVLAEPGWFTDPFPMLRRYGQIAGLISFLLLAADVVLPVPSSLLMVANGALLGASAGAAVSLAANLVSSALGFWIGRRASAWLAPRSLPLTQAQDWLNRWGVLAIAASRPVPLLAESVSIVAGSTPLSWQTLLLASLAGSAPASVVYAYAGARSVEPAGAMLVFGLTIALAAALWLIGYLTSRT